MFINNPFGQTYNFTIIALLNCILLKSFYICWWYMITFFFGGEDSGGNDKIWDDLKHMSSTWNKCLDKLKV